MISSYYEVKMNAGQSIAYMVSTMNVIYVYFFFISYSCI